MSFAWSEGNRCLFVWGTIRLYSRGDSRKWHTLQTCLAQRRSISRRQATSTSSPSSGVATLGESGLTSTQATVAEVKMVIPLTGGLRVRGTTSAGTSHCAHWQTPGLWLTSGRVALMYTSPVDGSRLRMSLTRPRRAPGLATYSGSSSWERAQLLMGCVLRKPGYPTT